MKTASTREVQHHFSSILDWVEEGEEVVVTRRGEKVARLVRYVEPGDHPVTIPDFREMRQRLSTSGSDGKNSILEERDGSL